VGSEMCIRDRLFVDRALAVNARFRLTDENAPSVAEICERLDGIPLATELAAARSNVLAPAQLAKRLDQRFRLLTGGDRTALPRQQRMRALIDWSYDLMTDRERALFRALAVFAGSFTYDSAESVCANGIIPKVADVKIVSKPAANCLQTVVKYQRVLSQRYFDVAGFPGRTVGLDAESGKQKTAWK